MTATAAPDAQPSLVFIGTGEACDPDLPNTSILYRGSRTVLLDCGYGVPHALWRVTRNPDLLDAIYLSHAHADHTFGLPALLLWMHEAGRQRPLTVLAGPWIDPGLERIVELAYPGLLSQAPGYRVEVEALCPAKPHALGLLTLLTAETQHGSANLAVRIEEGGRAFCYSGDGATTESTRRLYRAASVVCHECYHDAPGSASHAHFDEVMDVARQADVGCLCLVHLKASDRQAVIARARATRDDHGMSVIVPSPGDTLPLS